MFIQEAVKKAKAAGNGTDIQAYPWLNKDETNPRMKVAGLSYVPSLDWTIGVSAYYDDFQTGALGAKGILLTLLISMFVGGLLILLISNRISSPLRKMAKAGNEIASGNLDAVVPEVKSGDEVEDIGNTIGMLVGAIRYFKQGDKK